MDCDFIDIIGLKRDEYDDGIRYDEEMDYVDRLYYRTMLFLDGNVEYNNTLCY